MNKNPLVSVIIPCYNHEKYIADCLKSIIYQTYKNIEIIICDDCSTDNSFRIIKSYENILNKRFVNVIIYKNEENKGVTKNLNSLISKCNGIYIKNIASDDILTENAIQTYVDYFLNNNDVDILFTNAYEINEEANFEMLNDSIFKKKYDDNFKYENIKHDLFTKNSILASSVCMPMETYRRYGLYDENLLFEDREYWIRVNINGGKIAYLNIPTSYYRYVNNSLSHIKNDDEFNMRVYNSEKNTLNKYIQFVNKDIVKGFYNYQLGTYYNKESKKMINIIKKDIKELGLGISVKNKLKNILYNTGLINISKSLYDKYNK